MIKLYNSTCDKNLLFIYGRTVLHNKYVVEDMNIFKCLYKKIKIINNNIKYYILLDLFTELCSYSGKFPKIIFFYLKYKMNFDLKYIRYYDQLFEKYQNKNKINKLKYWRAKFFKYIMY